MQCLLCKSTECKEIFQDGDLPVRRCLKCGHVYSSYQGQEDYSEYFSEDIQTENHFWWREAHLRMYAAFRKQFLQGRSGHLLDVGCGLGYFLASVRDDKLCVKWSLAGCEISLPASSFAKHQLGLKGIKHGSIAAAAYSDNQFELITLWDVIEHLPNPRLVLSEIRRILKDEGALFVATPNINVQLPKARLKKRFSRKKIGHYLEARDHLHIYSPRTLSRLLSEAGFRDIRYLQLPPITSASGHESYLLSSLKEIWHQLAKGLFLLSAGRLNINNLYVVAYK